MAKAFFSKLNHETWDGNGAQEFPHAATGKKITANYIGTEVGGYPGFTDEAGTVRRPPNFESYIYVGDLQQGKIYPPDMVVEADPRMATERLTHAIFDKNLRGVKEAILDGANVNAPGAFYSDDPLWLHHMARHDYDRKNQAVYTEIDAFIIPYAKGAMDKENNSALENFHRAFGFQNTEIASSVVLLAIKESRGAGRINLPEYFTGYGKPGEPYAAIRQERKANILAIHQRVSERLTNPTTAFEREVSASLTEKNRNYWTASLSFPDLADLPMPSQQFADALDQMMRAGKEMGEILEPFVTRDGMRPMPQGDRTAFNMASDEAKEASVEIDNLRQEGRLGFQMPKAKGKPFDKA